MSRPSVSEPSSLRAIPSVDQLLRSETANQFRDLIGAARLTDLARQAIDELREGLQNSSTTETKNELLTKAASRLEELCRHDRSAGIRRVINATGVILHTNLGRAPLSDAARKALTSEAAGYCTVEYDLGTGTRGRRAARVEELLVQVTGGEAGLVVNNCASAALLILSVLARDAETIVSRGELVEIGGDFRVPEVMSNSGTQMVEVGTTNRTKLEDYRRAISDRTRLIMRVHPSNYRIIGFTHAPALKELATLAHEKGLLLYEDAGSGVVTDLSKFGLGEEPLIRDSIDAGVDVVSFSGDKLLGASQAGLIVGRHSVIERLRKHSLYRALRADKLCLAVLEVTLNAHRRGALEEIPALRMLGLSKEVLEQRATEFAKRVNEASDSISARLVPGESAVGGGSGPNVHPATTLISLSHATLTANELEQSLRQQTPPAIGRISDDQLLLDLRTVEPNEEPELLTAVLNMS